MKKISKNKKLELIGKYLLNPEIRSRLCGLCEGYVNWTVIFRSLKNLDKLEPWRGEHSGYEMSNPTLESVLVVLQEAQEYWNLESTVFKYTRPEQAKTIEEHFDGLRGSIIELDGIEKFDNLTEVD